MNQIYDSRPLARYEIASGATIACGSLVALDGSGKAVSASDTAGLRVIGAAVKTVDGKVEVGCGIIAFANDAGNPLTRADRGKAAFIKDALTVDAAGGTNKITAGIVVDVIDGDVYLDLTPAALAVAELAQK